MAQRKYDAPACVSGIFKYQAQGILLPFKKKHKYIAQKCPEYNVNVCQVANAKRLFNDVVGLLSLQLLDNAKPGDG